MPETRWVPFDSLRQQLFGRVVSPTIFGNTYYESIRAIDTLLGEMYTRAVNKYCRICWNTRNWRLPSGDARRWEIGESYVAEHGFGHEEWLFNFEWLLSGYAPHDKNKYRYGFLQPINSHRHLYVGHTLSILAYTIDPAGDRMAVALIPGAYVPFDDELSWVLEQVHSRGWLETMRQDLRGLGIPGAPLLNPGASTVANIRFLPERVVFFDPMLPLRPPHKSTTTYRYQPLDWDDGFQLPPSQVNPPLADSGEDSGPLKTERLRPAQPATIVELQHAMLEERLHRALQAHFGKLAVDKEIESVDLRLTQGGHVTFIEIKMESTVKKCIRLSLGQLIEYAHYPNLRKADDLLVVGDATPDTNDVAYLDFIRETYHIPVHYAQWSWTANELGTWI